MSRFSWVAVLLPLVYADSPQPYSVPASQYWDGDDGQWSTFSFQVGSPYQQVRLLPSTSGSAFAPILNAGCSSDDGIACPSNRGSLFNPNASTSWSGVGVYQYSTPYSQSGLLGDSANASYGTDTITLAWPGSPAPVIPNQIIGGLVSDTSNWYYVGQLGLSPRPVNISTLSDSHQTTLSYLKSSSQIPSISWAYTAGFHNQDAPAYGSLTLGGYDQTRFRPNNVTFPFGVDISRDLLVAIQRIASDKSGNTALLPSPVFALIDSEVPTIVLPEEACRAFEQAFNLTYYKQNGQGYYLLTDQQHQSLISLSPSITFTLGPSLARGSTVDISLPYAAFDLQLSAPLGRNGTRYFPLQQGMNSSQYVLGRTFLQHAYVIADYDRSNFSVSQALFPQNSAPQIKSIDPPGSGGGSTSSSGISGGAIAGLVIGVAAALIVFGALLWFFLFHKRRQRKRHRLIELENSQFPFHGNAAPTDDEGYRKMQDLIAERATLNAQGVEMGGSKRDSRPEMYAGHPVKQMSELCSIDRPREMDAGQMICEMEGGAERFRPGKKHDGPVFELA